MGEPPQRARNLPEGSSSVNEVETLSVDMLIVDPNSKQVVTDIGPPQEGLISTISGSTDPVVVNWL